VNSTQTRQRGNDREGAGQERTKKKKQIAKPLKSRNHVRSPPFRLTAASATDAKPLNEHAPLSPTFFFCSVLLTHRHYRPWMMAPNHLVFEATLDRPSCSWSFGSGGPPIRAVEQGLRLSSGLSIGHSIANYPDETC